MRKNEIIIAAILILSILCFLSISKTNQLTANAQDEAKNELMIETFSGTGQLERELLSAQKYIHIEMYGFTDFDLFGVLIACAKKGVEVKVMLERAPYQAETENWDARYNLTKFGITCKWTSPEFFLTHAKFMVIDGVKAIVFTGNWTYSSFSKDREFALIMMDETKAQMLETLFQKDWAREKFENPDPDLIISPIDSRVKIETALKSAQKTIKIWEQSVEDESIINILKEAKARGVDVKMINPPLSSTPGNSNAVNALPGCVRSLPNPYVHAKTFIIDDSFAYIGSNNFTTPSLENERETAVFTRDEATIKILLDLWEIDWVNSKTP